MRVPLLLSAGDAGAVADAAPDAWVVDLGDASQPGDRAERRRRARDLLARAAASDTQARRVIRIAAMDDGCADGDLDAAMTDAPDAVWLPGAVGAADIQRLAAKLAVREAEHGLAAGVTGIVAVPADTARGVLALSALPGASPRLRALVWDPVALARDLGVEGTDAAPCRVARGLLLAAAAAAGVPALDAGPWTGDGAGDCDAARRDGFSGKLALRPEQVALVRRCFAGSR